MIQRLFRAALLSITLAFTARVAGAQSVPAVSGSLSFGSGSTSSHAGELWFSKASAELWSVDLAVRLGGAGSTRPVLLLGYDLGVNAQYVNLICRPAPNGSCFSDFPAPLGPSIGVGVRQVVGRWVVLGVGAGVAHYDGTARFAEADLSVRLFSHFALVSEFRYIDLTITGQRAFFTPLTFGARINW
jgi:hypothetical protein